MLFLFLFTFALSVLVFFFTGLHYHFPGILDNLYRPSILVTVKSNLRLTGASTDTHSQHRNSILDFAVSREYDFPYVYPLNIVEAFLVLLGIIFPYR